MGVPKFFSYLLKKYKNDDFLINRETSIQSYKTKLNNLDYLLLDANGFMHPACSKVLAENPTIIDDDKLQVLMHKAIIDKLQEYVDYVKPKKGVFIAVDGVAPVAKMRQQRFRRYITVADRIMKNKLLTKYNKPTEHPWSNNVITPGTEFMNILHKKIIKWCEEQKLEIYYSSCYSYGEGEHKLIHFIKQNPKYSYVIHGLDADLIFLSLATGLDDIYLLRESGAIDKNDKTNSLKFIIINKLRTVIPDTMNEFINIKADNKRLLDDFVLLCYLLGNDFLPHLNAIDIAYNGIELILKTYGNMYNKTSQYLLDKLIINENNFLELFIDLTKAEENILHEKYHNKKNWRIISSDPYERELSYIENLKFPVEDPIMIGSDNYNSWRERYYKYYFDINTKEELEEFSKKLVFHYVMGIKWVVLYYFDKCPSWEWYYPFEYIAPFIGDIALHLKSISIKNIEFKLYEPVNPIVQLLSILPPQSSFILPKIFQKLVTDDKSSLAYLYPTIIERDFIGKIKFYQGMPKLPPMDITLVKHIYKKYEDMLSSCEKENIKPQKIFEFNIYRKNISNDK